MTACCATPAATCTAAWRMRCRRSTPISRRTSPPPSPITWPRPGARRRPRRCWLEAARRAVGTSALTEATRLLRRGLDAAHALEASPGRTRLELALRGLLGPALMALNGPGAAETREHYERSYALCQTLEEEPGAFPALLGLVARLGRFPHHAGALRLAARARAGGRRSRHPAAGASLQLGELLPSRRLRPVLRAYRGRARRVRRGGLAPPRPALRQPRRPRLRAWRARHGALDAGKGEGGRGEPPRIARLGAAPRPSRQHDAQHGLRPHLPRHAPGPCGGVRGRRGADRAHRRARLRRPRGQGPHLSRLGAGRAGGPGGRAPPAAGGLRAAEGYRHQRGFPDLCLPATPRR